MSTITQQTEGNVLVLRFNVSKIQDNTQIDVIGQELVESAMQAPGKKLLIDFRDVAFMSSAMISKLVTLNSKCKASQVQLVLCEMSPGVHEIFKITRLTKIFNIHATKDEALASLDG